MNRVGALDLTSIRLVSWDVDGTLYSLQRMRWRLFRRSLREIALGRGPEVAKDLATLRHYRAMIDTTRKAGGVLKEVHEETHRRKIGTIEERWYGPAIREAGPRAGVTDLLEFFSTCRLPQVVLSDYQADYKLRLLKLESYFVSVYAGECLGLLKPNPGAFEKMASDWAILPAQILHLGDREDTDGSAAGAAGCQFLILGKDFRDFHWLLTQLRLKSST